jgi:hypothetical protein
MPELNFNALIPQGPRSVTEGFNLGQEQRNQLMQQQQARQLNEIQLQNALRDQQTAAAEQEAYKGAADLEDARKRLLARGLGKQSVALQKQIDEQRTAKLTQAKTQVELVKSTANQIFANPQNAAQILTSFNQRTGIDISDDLAQLQQLGGNPEAIKQWAAGHVLEADKMLPKFQEFSTPGGGKQLGTVNPMTGEFTANKTMAPQLSPYEQARIGQENQRLAQEATGVVYQEDANGNVIALPSRLKKGEVPTARVAVAPGAGFQPLQGKPSEAVGKEQMSINQQRAIVKGAIDAVTAAPDAFGMMRGITPEAIGGRMASSDENQARSYLFNVVSGVIKERAGTAQSAAEADTLRRFLPVETDTAPVIKDKMLAFDKYLLAKESGTTKKRGGPTAPTLSTVDQQALQWANSNPADPRAAAIKQRLGM